jgi:hypothetical protein
MYSLLPLHLEGFFVDHLNVSYQLFEGIVRERKKKIDEK